MDVSDLSVDKMTLFELKEKAKWSNDLEGKKAAIKKLSTLGESAISELEEIMNITASEDIKNVCAEAIKSMHATSSFITKSSNNDSSSASQSNLGLSILLDSASVYYGRGDYKKADIFFERVLEIEPNNIDALNGKGTSLYRLADYDKARNCFEKVLQMDPKNIVALNNIKILNKKKDEDTSQQKEKPAPSQASSQQKEKPAPSQASSQQKEKPAPSHDSGTISRADSRNPYNDPTLPYYNPDLGKKKDEDTSQQKERPAPSAAAATGTTTTGADSRNPYNDPTLPYYNPDLGKKNN